MQRKPKFVPMSKMVKLKEVKQAREMPKLTWAKVVWKDMAACDLKTDIALDRVEWRNKICEVDPK